MSRESIQSNRYYYAGGKRVELRPAEDLFVEGPDMRGFDATMKHVGRSLGEGLRLLTNDELASQKRSSPAIAQYPVFRSHGAILVALPEVRIEESRKSQWAKLNKWLENHRDDVTVLSRDDDRLVLRPVSGLGDDALTIANDLAEKIGPEMAQARFIRVTSRRNS